MEPPSGELPSTAICLHADGFAEDPSSPPPHPPVLVDRIVSDGTKGATGDGYLHLGVVG